MKKIESSVASAFNEKSIAVYSMYENVKTSDRADKKFLQIKFNAAKALKSSRKFKIALVSSYAFLISVFVVIVYIADVLDPRFPF